MIWLQGLCILGIAISLTFWIVSLLCTIAFFRRRSEPSESFRPPVSILKPMRGLDDDLEPNLREFCAQDYPVYQILFGVEQETDPCVPILRKIIGEFPDQDIALIICGENGGANRKVNNLRSLLPRAKHDLIVIADSDIRVGDDYLQRVVAPLADEKVGLVCCPYRWKGPRTVPAAIEALSFCTEFIPSVLLLERLEGLKFALGATMVVRRRCLDEIGGFAAIQDYLADDYLLGLRVYERGHKLVLCRYVVDLIHHETDWHQMMRHQLRLARTNRVCRPIGYFFSVLTHGMTWATLFLMLSGFTPLSWAVWSMTLAIRWAGAFTLLLTHFPDLLTTAYAWALPLRDWLGTLWWLLAYTGRRVRWRGHTLTLTRDGRLRPLLAAEPRPATVQ